MLAPWAMRSRNSSGLAAQLLVGERRSAVSRALTSATNGRMRLSSRSFWVPTIFERMVLSIKDEPRVRQLGPPLSGYFSIHRRPGTRASRNAASRGERGTAQRRCWLVRRESGLMGLPLAHTS